MLIISKTHDYYDPVAKTTGVDKGIIFLRKEEYAKFSWPETRKGLENFPYNCWWDNGDYRTRECIFYAFAIGFCNKTYLGIELDYETHLYQEDALAWVDNNVISSWGKKRFDYWRNFQFPLDLYRKYQSPILRLTPKTHKGETLRRESLDELIINPNLKSLNFQTIVDSFTAFQEIQMFISGILGAKEKETIVISDQSKIIEAGFDPKWSFRKPPKDK